MAFSSQQEAQTAEKVGRLSTTDCVKTGDCGTQWMQECGASEGALASLFPKISERSE